MIALVDCNNFYCSCERLFQPRLDQHPVVVLSNNDGCIVSRSNEAKALGIGMAVPYFEARSLIRKHDIAVFSSNYSLYGDLSWRVMETLRQLMGSANVEVYSVDEAFLDLSRFPPEKWADLAITLKETVEQWTGIKVSIGIGPTKVLAKLANRFSKKEKTRIRGICLLDSSVKIKSALERTPVGEVWGVGRQYARKLQEQWGIENAFQLSQLSEPFARHQLGGVLGVRLVRELNGFASQELQHELLTKRMIASTRMFGQPVDSITDIREAVATYTSRAAEKLRRQQGAASTISVFIVPSQQNPAAGFHHGTSCSASRRLPLATSLTHELIKPAMDLVAELFEEGTRYKKAGVLLSGIRPDNAIQSSLFAPDSNANGRKLMEMVDNINFSQRNDILKFASSGTSRNWKMRQEMRSGRYTTRWEELFTVH